jgi:tricorn protease
MAGTVGKPTAVTYRPRTARGLEPERAVQVTPLAATRMGELLYDEWVATCRRRVEEATKGSVGYIHLDQMNGENLRRFVQAVQQWTNNPKIKGMILDIRGNGGGNIHLPLMQILTARPLARVTLRGRDPAVQPDTYWDRPVTLLINERSFSDAEVFPFMFKEAKCGQVVGVPTAGGVIGTNDITLSDGSSFRVPRTGFQSLDGKNLEGMGVKPDVFVGIPAEDRLQGRDPQLAKAIEIVTGEIAQREKASPPKETPPAPAPPPVVAADALHPLADAQPGEWVRYRALRTDTREETLFRITATKVEAGEVIFEREIERGTPNAAILPDRVARKSVLEVLPAFGELLGHEVGPGKVRDADAETLIARIRRPDGTELRLVFSNAVPCYGLLRAEQGDVVVLEALEWGVPAAPPAAAEEGPPNPLFDAVVGEWVRLKFTGPRGPIEVTRRVTDVTADEVTLTVTAVVEGRAVDERTERRPRSRVLAPLDGSHASFGRERLTVAGRELECVVMTYTRAGAEEKAWFAAEVPVTGVVRQERAGAVVAELLDWGKD